MLPLIANANENNKADLSPQEKELIENFEAARQELTTGFKDFSEKASRTLPILADQMSQMMQDFSTEAIPLMQAMQQSAQLLKADDQMAQSVQSSLPAPYKTAPNTQHRINAQTNELFITGEKKEKKKQLKFNLTRSLQAATITSRLITRINQSEEELFYKNTPSQIPAQKQLINLNNKNIPLKESKLDIIKNNIYLVYSNEESQETYIIGNLSSDLNLQVQTQGTEHLQRAKDFITSLDIKKIRQATTSDE